MNMRVLIPGLAAGALSPVLTLAQAVPQMSEEELRAMAGEIQAGLMVAQECMAQVDQTELQAVQQRGEAFGNKVLEFCQAGDRESAQFQVMTEGREIYESEVMTELRACFAESEEAQSIMQLFPNMDYGTLMASGAHICDELGAQ